MLRLLRLRPAQVKQWFHVVAGLEQNLAIPGVRTCVPLSAGPSGSPATNIYV